MYYHNWVVVVVVQIKQTNHQLSIYLEMFEMISSAQLLLQVYTQGQRNDQDKLNDFVN